MSMFNYRLIVDQVMKPKDWAMLAILVIFASSSLFLVWREFQEPIVFYQVNEVEKSVWQTEKTDQGTLVRNLDAGYEIVVPNKWDISHQAGVLKLHNNFNMTPTPTEAPTGCVLTVKNEFSRDHDINKWIVEYDSERHNRESEEIDSTVIRSQKNIKIANIEFLIRTYEPPIGPTYQEYYTYHDNKIFIITRVIGVVGENSISCGADFDLLINSFKTF